MWAVLAQLNGARVGGIACIVLIDVGQYLAGIYRGGVGLETQVEIGHVIGLAPLDEGGVHEDIKVDDDAMLFIACGFAELPERFVRFSFLAAMMPADIDEIFLFDAAVAVVIECGSVWRDGA